MAYDKRHKDQEPSVSDLLTMWAAGETYEVIDYLWHSPPNIAAFFMLEGIREKLLDQAGANTVVNLLTDRATSQPQRRRKS